LKQEFLEFCEQLKATKYIFEEHTSAKRKVNENDLYKAKEGKSALANRSCSGYTRNQNNKNL
jgi:hypothetical protein